MQVTPVQRIKAILVNLKPLQRPAGCGPVNLGTLGLGKVAHPA